MNTPNDIAFESLHPNARRLARVGCALVASVAIAAVLFAMAILASARFDVELGPALGLLPLIALLLGVPAGLWFADRRHDRTRFRLDADGLEIHSGLWWRRQTRVSRRRVQHTDINRGPLDRRLDLASLKVYTAGTRLASIELDGLPAERAIELRDALLADAGEPL